MFLYLLLIYSFGIYQFNTICSHQQFPAILTNNLILFVLLFFLSPQEKKKSNYTPEFQSSSYLTIIPEVQMYFKKCLYNVTMTDKTKM